MTGKGEEYTCYICKNTYNKGRSDEEAKAELASTFAVPVEECALVCESCYKKMGFGDV